MYANEMDNQRLLKVKILSNGDRGFCCGGKGGTFEIFGLFVVLCFEVRRVVLYLYFVWFRFDASSLDSWIIRSTRSEIDSLPSSLRRGSCFLFP